MRLGLYRGRLTIALLPPPDDAARPSIGSSCRGRFTIGSVESPHLLVRYCRFGRSIVEQGTRFSFRQVAVRHRDHVNGLPAAERMRDHDLVTLTDHAVGLGAVATHRHLPQQAGLLGLRPRLEKAGHIQPHVKPNWRHRPITHAAIVT
jgi:hypothetical protein